MLFRRRTEEPGPLAVGFFGKLPFYADYLESARASIDEAGLELCNWLMEGRKRLGNVVVVDSGARRHGATTVRGLRIACSLGRQDAVLAAVVWPSEDSLGRSFPFALYAACPRKRLGLEALEEAPLALDGLWERLEALARTPEGVPWSMLEPQDPSAGREVERALADASIAWEGFDRQRVERFEADLRSSKAAVFLAATFGAEPVKGCAEAFLALAWASYAAGGREGCPGGVRLPVGATLEPAHQASFWLRVQGRLAGAVPRGFPSIILPQMKDGEPGLWLLPRGLFTSDFDGVFGTGRASEDVLDLTVPGEARAALASRPEARALEGRIADLLERDTTLGELADLAAPAGP